MMSRNRWGGGVEEGWNMMLFCLGLRYAAEAVVTCVVIPHNYVSTTREATGFRPTIHSTLVLCTLLMVFGSMYVGAAANWHLETSDSRQRTGQCYKRI